MSKRQIVLDTETTGINPDFGHRIIEIAAVELIDRKRTERHFHCYLNPERAVDDGAFRVHGISTEFLQDKPLFAAVAQDFVDFVKDAELIIHNAPFDLGFLNKELSLLKWPQTMQDFCSIFDTLVFARDKHPGQRNSLDALCKRYAVDNSKRQLHGALLDADILAQVYLAMTGGQGSLFDEDSLTGIEKGSTKQRNKKAKALSSKAPIIAASAEELAEHQRFVEFLIKKSGIDLWSTKTQEETT